jgi:hypothetical protein
LLPLTTLIVCPLRRLLPKTPLNKVSDNKVVNFDFVHKGKKLDNKLYLMLNFLEKTRREKQTTLRKK